MHAFLRRALPSALAVLSIGAAGAAFAQNAAIVARSAEGGSWSRRAHRPAKVTQRTGAPRCTRVDQIWASSTSSGSAKITTSGRRPPSTWPAAASALRTCAVVTGAPAR